MLRCGKPAKAKDAVIDSAQDQTFWGLAVTVLPLFIFFIVLWDTLMYVYIYMYVCIYAGERGDAAKAKFVWGGRVQRVKGRHKEFRTASDRL